MRTSDIFEITNGIIMILFIGLLFTDEVTVEMIVKLIGLLLESGIVYAYLGFWAVVALFGIIDRLYDGHAYLSNIRSGITDFNYMYKKNNEQNE